MSTEISNETKQLMNKLDAKGLPVKEIEKKTGVSYTTAYNYVRLKKRMNPETGEPFESHNQYKEYTKRERRKKPGNIR